MKMWWNDFRNDQFWTDSDSRGVLNNDSQWHLFAAKAVKVRAIHATNWLSLPKVLDELVAGYLSRSPWMLKIHPFDQPLITEWRTCLYRILRLRAPIMMSIFCRKLHREFLSCPLRYIPFIILEEERQWLCRCSLPRLNFSTWLTVSLAIYLHYGGLRASSKKSNGWPCELLRLYRETSTRPAWWEKIDRSPTQLGPIRCGTSYYWSWNIIGQYLIWNYSKPGPTRYSWANLRKKSLCRYPKRDFPCSGRERPTSWRNRMKITPSLVGSHWAYNQSVW